MLVELEIKKKETSEKLGTQHRTRTLREKHLESELRGFDFKQRALKDLFKSNRLPTRNSLKANGLDRIGLVTREDVKAEAKKTFEVIQKKAERRKNSEDIKAEKMSTAYLVIREKAVRKNRNLLLRERKRITRQLTAATTDAPPRPEISLRDAESKVLELMKNASSVDQVEYCRQVMKKFQIKGTPNYSAEKLSNSVSQRRIKEANKKKPPR